MAGGQMVSCRQSMHVSVGIHAPNSVRCAVLLRVLIPGRAREGTPIVSVNVRHVPTKANSKRSTHTW